MRRAFALFAASLLVAACGGGAARPSPTPLRTPTPTVATRTVAPPTAASATDPALPCPSGPPAAKATIELRKGGAIILQLRPDKARCTVANFAKNARDGKYDGLTFHRVVADFVVQGGDPLGTGAGGGDQATELNDLPFTKGAVGVARANDIKISNLFQFYICIGSCRFLDGQYTNFGQVTSGQEIADGVKVGDRIKTIRIE